MKRYRIYLFTLILAVSFLIPSGSVLAKDGWTPQPLPAASIDTVFGDSRYIDPEWMTRRVTVSWQGTEWMTGMDAFRSVPVRWLS